MITPSFELKDMFTDQTVPLHAYKGKPLMLTFWASWCPDSQIDLSQKQRFYDYLDTHQLGFLTINVTGREGKEENAKEFIEKEGYTFPVLLDNGTKTYDRYHCMGVPTTFILDADQQIINRFNDKAAFLDIMKGMNQVLGKK
ncbi:TlpA disulfide reductase family protein [Alteribacillus sp. YIM 98480]|uniref:TlpA disulfide reductase family protein n=1 Tax=Alteribacillus sp. YIM 98480 TaxID=2606599 RepID=UPI00131B9DE2|nr:TlpA disulfide reductase family protein [Alteribacillus sp. YIM 98480]